MLGRVVTVAALAAGGVMLKKKLGQMRNSTGTSTVEETVEVNVPLSTAYNQFTQFEEFPNFMKSVEEVRQLDDTHLQWRARIGGKEVQWRSEITSQIPDKRIAWQSTSGPRNSGAVSFERISDSRTRVTLRMTYEPPGPMEKMADSLGMVEQEASGNLRRFAEFIEGRRTETGAWRGTVSGGATVGEGAGTGTGAAGTGGTMGTPSGTGTGGTPGTMGTSGTTGGMGSGGTPGTMGTSGTTGTSGTPGTAGYGGTSGSRH